MYSAAFGLGCSRVVVVGPSIAIAPWMGCAVSGTGLRSSSFTDRSSDRCQLLGCVCDPDPPQQVQPPPALIGPVPEPRPCVITLSPVLSTLTTTNTTSTTTATYYTTNAGSTYNGDRRSLIWTALCARGTARGTVRSLSCFGDEVNLLAYGRPAIRIHHLHSCHPLQLSTRDWSTTR